jgi:hypothetical protein
MWECIASALWANRPTNDRVAKTSPAGLQSFGFISDDLSEYMTGEICPAATSMCGSLKEQKDKEKRQIAR